MADNVDETKAEEAEVKLPAAVQLQNDVKTEIETLDTPGAVTSTRQQVIQALADAELERRVEILSSALLERKKLESQVKKIKPDQIFYDADGKVTNASFTKAKADELRKSKEKLQKLDRLIDAVIDTPTADAYNKLSNFK